MREKANLLEKILNIIFPKKCAFCKTIIKKDYTCKKCKKNLEYICNNHKIEKVNGKYFELLISSYEYKEKIRDKILEFKFKNKKYLYKPLAELLLNDITQYISNSIDNVNSNTENYNKSDTNDYIANFDCIVYVPISIKRYFERGYNQSKLIAKFISQKLNKPLINYALLKIKHNQKQSKLGILQRKQNVEGAYKILNKNAITQKNILLIDDIYTTGATANECSKILKQNGAKSIIVATIAKAEINKHII